MSYNINELPHYMNTAGKITILTALSGVLIFAFVFLFNVGKTEFEKVQAQNPYATTTLTVLNTPPDWLAASTFAVELYESSTSSPTNSGTSTVWVGTAEDSNSAPYFMIVCDTDVAPVPGQAASLLVLGSEPPTCGPGARTWAVSPAASSSEPARAATTTTESFPPFAEVNEWYAWVCDDDPVNPRCNTATSTGLNATNSSPFHVNRRPTFTSATDTSPADPGALVTFNSVAADPDSVGGSDNIVLHICYEQDFGTGTSSTECGPGGYIASSTFPGSDTNPNADFTLPTIIQDQNYAAYAYIVDEHGHTAVNGAQATNTIMTVNNVAPTVGGATIVLDGGTPIDIDVELGETLGKTLEFETYDANSCDAVGGGNADEVVGYVLSVFRDGVGTSTCDGSAGSYNPNNCYPSGVGAAVWNLSCTASTTSCTPGGLDATMDWDCTFPLWYVADPTDGGSPSSTEQWTAAVSAIDNNNATGTYTSSTMPVDLNSFTAFDLNTFAIPYGSLEPGDDTGTLSASTTIIATGNTGIDHLLSGAAMCGTYTNAVTCPVSSTSTIAVQNQKYGTSSFAYSSPQSFPLATTTAEQEINVPKSTSTSTPASGRTYWGIFVPGTITLAGSYTGANTFQVVVGEPSEW